MKKFKKTIQFNNKPLLMTTQAIEMIVIPVRKHCISIFLICTHQYLRYATMVSVKTITIHLGKFRAVAW